MSNMEEYRNLDIDSGNLDKEMETQASKFLYVAELAVQAEMQYETYKVQVAGLTAEIGAKIRTDAATELRKITEAVVTQDIERNPAYVDAVKSLIQYRARRDMLKALRDAWYQRKDLLIQRCIKERTELDILRSGSVVKVEEGKAAQWSNA